MRKLAIFTILVALCGSISAQRALRSEFTLYDTREDALTANHSQTVNHIPFVAKSTGTLGTLEMFEMEINVPASWNDYNTYLHLENIRTGYDVAINSLSRVQIRLYCSFVHLLAQSLTRARKSLRLSVLQIATSLHSTALESTILMRR